ncbi:helix-turn-helix domain-containing protein [Streptomyces griseoaurantiacus]|uniref:Helix-turn-helix domain-containing protein n=1 Tax=Streptomyces griseoaurantiacus TaxID=68213 RepID=A0ABZ1V4Y4_9ACTN|nr:helix-turn-helix domain-containing protein [Streptomyces jietaisiensis]
MGTRNPSAPPRSQSADTADKPPSRAHWHPGRRPGPRAFGVTHENTRHTSRFTVIGNHLAQHPELSLVAIALAVHIQSLPSNALVDIKTLATRFPEGRTRIAAGLRELEAHGYLRRERERTPSGRVITRTVSCNQPGASRRHAPTRTTPPEPPPPLPQPQPESAGAPDATTTSEPHPPRGKRKPHPLPPVPRPPCHSPAMLETATEFLCGLRRHDPRLVFSACDTAHLAPGVVAWMQYDVPLSAVRTALTADLPPEHDLRRPAALLAHRLTALLPPPPPVRAPAGPPPQRHPLHNCDGCDRAFRAPEPGRCGDCRAAAVRL